MASTRPVEGVISNPIGVHQRLASGFIFGHAGHLQVDLDRRATVKCLY
ncbi:MAG: hypothetical protein Q7U01_08825 [Pseudomonas sp.]|nr:hypothetical protein [Pseudomonas sp.]